MYIHSLKKKLKETFHHAKNLNGFKDLYSSMSARHVWPGIKYQRNHAGYKRLISSGCCDWAELRTVVCQIQSRRPVSPGPPAQWTPSNPRLSIFEGSCRRWFECDKSGIGNRVRILPENNNQRITWDRKGLQAREMDSFQTDRKPQGPENNTCQSMLSMAKKANFFDLILTGDKKWFAFDNTHRGLQWLDPDQMPEGTPKP